MGEETAGLIMDQVFVLSLLAFIVCIVIVVCGVIYFYFDYKKWFERREEEQAQASIDRELIEHETS